MMLLTDATLRAGAWLTSTLPPGTLPTGTLLTGTEPSPTPSGFGVFTGDEDLVTPGVVGFIITFLIAAATVLLVLDMVRRIRRTRYREEIRAKLEAEARAEDAGETPSRESRADTDPEA